MNLYSSLKTVDFTCNATHSFYKMSTVGQNLAEIRDIDANNLPNLQFFWAKERKIVAINSKAIAVSVKRTRKNFTDPNRWGDRSLLAIVLKINLLNCDRLLQSAIQTQLSQPACQHPQLKF